MFLHNNRAIRPRADRQDEIGSEKRRRQYMRNNFRQFITAIDNSDLVTEFSPEAWTALVESVTVNARDDIRFTFRNGMDLTAAIDL